MSIQARECRHASQWQDPRHGAERIDPTNDFMAGNDWEFWVRQFAIDNMKISAADATGFDAEKFAISRDTVRKFFEDERRTNFAQDHAKHCKLPGE